MPLPRVLRVCCRYGEVVNINLVRDKKTGKSKGFCFLCYEDQRSTILAVDNFNGIKVSEAAWDVGWPACDGPRGAAARQTGALAAQVAWGTGLCLSQQHESSRRSKEERFEWTMWPTIGPPKTLMT